MCVCILGNSQRNVFIHHQHHSNSRSDVTAHCAGCWPHCAAHKHTHTQQQQNPTPAGFLQATSKNNNRNVSWQSANSSLSRSAVTSQQAARNETKQVFLLLLRIRHKAATHAAAAESQRAAAERVRKRETERANVQNAVARAGFSLLLYFLFLPFHFLQACNDDDAALLCMYTRHDTRARTHILTNTHTHTCTQTYLKFCFDCLLWFFFRHAAGTAAA